MTIFTQLKETPSTLEELNASMAYTRAVELESQVQMTFIVIAFSISIFILYKLYENNNRKILNNKIRKMQFFIIFVWTVFVVVGVIIFKPYGFSINSDEMIDITTWIMLPVLAGSFCFEIYLKYLK
jgi:hypothetical protein